MRILLTGAAGFIGSQIRLLAQSHGHDVVPLDCYLPLAHGQGPRDGTIHVRDLSCDPLDDLLEGIDVVCHQAAMVGNGVDAQDLPGYARHNDVGTARLLAAMARADVADLVLASSMVVYGQGRYRCQEHGEVAPAPRSVARLKEGRFDPTCVGCDAEVTWIPVVEDAPFAPQTGYAVSKLSQELLAGSWCTLQQARTIALRYHNAYGPGLPANTPYAGVAAIFRSAIARGEAPCVFEDGGQTRDFVHVTDLARANLLAIEAVRDHPREVTAYNVASGEPITIGQVAAILASAAGGTLPVTTGQYRSFDVRHVVASPDRARRELGFSAQVAPAEGLAALASEPLRD